jgi:predicted porin
LEKIEMKKTLVALAALASVSAFAQVSMTGYFDRGYVTTNNTNDYRDAKAVSSNAGTTTVVINGKEDLGSGLSAGFLVATDWAEASGQTQDGSTATIGVGGFANSQSFIELSSKDMGTFRLGNPNSEVLVGVTSVASPAFSTGVGSAYSSNYSIHNGYGTGTTGSNNIFANSIIGVGAGSVANNVGQRAIRQTNTIKYISPNFNGISATYTYVAKNDVGGTVSISGSGGTTDVVGVKGFSLNYANGPLTAVYAVDKVSVGQNGSSALANNSTTGGTYLQASTSTSMSILGASYQVMPTLKLHAGVGTSTNSNQTAFTVQTTGQGIVANTTSSQYGATFDVTPSIVLMAQVASMDDKSTTNTDRKMTGLGADYKLSKLTRFYVRTDNINYASNLTASSGTAQKRTAIGFSSSF